MRLPEWGTAALLAGALLAACAAPGTPPPKDGPAPAVTAATPAPAPTLVPAPVPASPAPPLADYIQRVRSMSPEALSAESARLALDKAPLARLHEAIVLAAPNNVQRDEMRALTLAQAVVQDAGTPPALRDGAGLVALWLEDQRTADAAGRRAQAKARDDERRIEQLETRVRELERRAGDAEKKLEALRAIEREMSARGAANGPRP
jgi:hypothetical protein